jgi:DNA repair protein RecO (recombination protein O)
MPASRSNGAAAPRWEAVPAYVLHSYPYKETSLIVEVFTAPLGRVAMVAKGAKRPNSALRGLMQPFLPLHISFSGKAEVKTLIKAEWQPGMPLLMNELILKLLPREDAHQALFDAYGHALSMLALQRDGESATTLRAFELALISQLGYGLSLNFCADTQRAVVPDLVYAWQPDRGIVPAHTGDGQSVRGATLLALAAGGVCDPITANDAKRFMRRVIDYHLEKRALGSRQLMRDLQLLSERAA